MLKNNISTCYETLVLNHNEFNESILYRITKNSVLHICPGPSLLGKSITLYCNYPQNGDYIDRHKYNILQWHCNKTRKPITLKNNPNEVYSTIINTEMYCEINPQIPGSYHFYFKYENDKNNIQGSGYFCKDPKIQIGLPSNLITLNPDAVICQTVLVKCLGPLTSWESKLRVAKESGYNMIHLTPIQELGESQSSYCIKDQLILNSAIGADFKALTNVLNNISNNWKIAFVSDIVLNHTANESEWLKEHPECSYNCKNSPHLRPAALLDFLLYTISKDISVGKLESSGISSSVFTEDTLQIIKIKMLDEYLPKLKLWEFYQLNIDVMSEEFKKLCVISKLRKNKIVDHSTLNIIQDPDYNRLSSKIDLSKALDAFFIQNENDVNDENHIQRCGDEFRQYVTKLNSNIFDEIQFHLSHAVDNIISGLRYERVREDGPKYKLINEKYPLFSRYFTNFFGSNITIEEAEKIIFSDDGMFVMAHNGWIMNSDPLKDFARYQGNTGNVYLRRELIAWGDCVKLRYGDCIEDSPYLWNHMKNYVEQSAEIFHGVRLDNCHSTPLHVAEYLLDCARKINPNLYIMAELFTNSGEKDNIFVNRLGITSLIREAQSAWDSHEQGRLVYRYGGEPLGSFDKFERAQENLSTRNKINIVNPVIANALFMDLTHDNPSPIEKRSVYDLIPTSALVSMACCGIGSNRGYDELVPHHIHVVNETRKYGNWNENLNNCSIVPAKKCLNDLHKFLSNNGFSEVYVDQMTEHIVTVTRHNPQSHESIILTAYACFKHPDHKWPVSYPSIRPLCFEGHFNELLFEISLEEVLNIENSFKTHDEYINGLQNFKVNIRYNIKINESSMLEDVSPESTKRVFNFKNFRPGSVLAIKVSLNKFEKESINNLNEICEQINSNTNFEFITILKNLNLNHSNEILYKCDKEERDNNCNIGVYHVPNYGPLVYCGLQGFISVLDDIKKTNDLGHPLCCNLREGNWMIDYPMLL